MDENKKYWEFKSKSNKEADLYLYVEIASWGGGYYAHSAKSFKAELDALGEIEKLNIYINSPGGDVFEGEAITNMLKRMKCKKIGYVDGLAASIASHVLTACDEVYMPGNTMQMVHNAWSSCCGYAKDMIKCATTLEKITESIKQSYIDASNGLLDYDTITELMNNETWLTAQECKDYGLCTDVIADVEISAKVEGESLNKFQYKHIPKNLLITDGEPEDKPQNQPQDKDLERQKALLRSTKILLKMENF